MSWLIVAKRVALDPYRSYYLWVELLVFGLVFGLSAYFQATRDVTLGAALVLTVSAFVTLIAIARSYRTIASRRQNGSLRVMLSYPHSRQEIVLGTVVGRGIIIIGTVSFGFAVAVVVYFVRSGIPAPVPLLYSWLAALLLGVTMTTLTVGISASARTTNRAVLISFSAIILFFAIWKKIPDTLRYALNGFSPPVSTSPLWEHVFIWVNPFQAYFAVVGGLTPYTNGFDGFYVTTWFGVLVLLGWMVVVPLIGILQLERSDL